MKSFLKEKVLRSGIIFTGLNLIIGACNFLFQIIIGRRLGQVEFGLVNATAPFMTLLGMPVDIARTAVVHHIAHFSGTGDQARLQGLLAGCRSFLFKLTLVGCVLATILIQPLSSYFNIPRVTLTISALVTIIVGLWGAYAVALCQGMGWFKRLALLGFVSVLLKLAFVWVGSAYAQVAELGVLATGVGTLANMLVFIWWKDLFKSTQSVSSPWGRGFFQYLIIAAAGVSAQMFFTQGDVLVAKKYFTDEVLGAYTAAARISSAMHLAVGPLLVVLFTARSSERAGKSIAGPVGLLVLYATGLITGAVVVFVARDFCVQLLFKQPFPLANAMVSRIAFTMIFVGLIQALGMWALASHWLKIGILYGVLGLTYWIILLVFGKTPTVLLQIMPVAAACSFTVMLCAWIIGLRKSRRTPAATN